MSIRVRHNAASDTVVLHERARRYEGRSREGALSIKSMSGGVATYVTRRGRYRVDDGSYLVLNHGTSYSISIDEPRPVESFCIFFAPGLVEGVLRALTTPEERLLGEPAPVDVSPADVCERTYPHDRALTPLLMRLREASSRSWAESGWWDERLHTLAACVVKVDRESRREAAAISAVRRSTREERYRRLHRARDYMEASLGEPLRLADIADVAAMAPFHFLRAFKELFGVTPHRYLVARRLERAKRLLLTTDLSVTEVGLSVGFDSLGSFSSLFRRRTAASPEAYRRRQTTK